MSSLRFKGCANFRQRIICATLTGRRIRIDDIRSEDEEPGVTDFEASFLRIVDKLTNGSQIEINETGTTLRYTPGVIVGSQIEHDCGTSRAIGWFLEGVLPLCPFAKQPISMVLKGVTNDDKDLCVDTLRTVTLPLLKHFGVDQGGEIQFKVKKRGAQPSGGGEVYFSCPIVRELKPINVVDEGLVKRIRGIAYTTRVSPQTGNRMVEAARGIFNRFIPDVYIYTDHYKGAESGSSPGFGISLVAETTTGCLLSVEKAATGGTLPEDLGNEAAKLLCQQISMGGVVDNSHQALVLLLMVLCPEDVSRVRFGKLSPYSVSTLRLIRDFFGVTFKVRPDSDGGVLLSCLGIGYKNLAKKVT